MNKPDILKANPYYRTDSNYVTFEAGRIAQRDDTLKKTAEMLVSSIGGVKNDG